MAKQAIEQILAAELASKQITDAIPTRVKALMEEAEQRSRAICADAERRALAERDEHLHRLRARAELFMSRSEADAQAEAERLRAGARKTMPEAVKRIIWEMMVKWQ